MSPQMTLTGHEDGVHLAGALEVPVFNLNVRELPTSAVNVSRGVVVTSYPSDRPDLERSISAGEATLFDIPITANLKISLGEQVSFSGFGLQAALQGSLDIQQLAGGSNLIYGELNVTNGSYQTYG
jgi:translocation and assembly module TamB